MSTCPMCGIHKIDEDDEYFLTEEIQICETCGERLDELMYGESSEAMRSARAYLEKIRATTDHSAIRKILASILDDYKATAMEAEEEEDEEPTLWQEMRTAMSFSEASGRELPYVVYQVTLREKFLGTGSGNLEELEEVINHFYRKGYRLHTMSTANGGSKGGFGGDRIQATLVFEKIGLFSR